MLNQRALKESTGSFSHLAVAVCPNSFRKTHLPLAVAVLKSLVIKCDFNQLITKKSRFV
jgi:hypothetical protein